MQRKILSYLFSCFFITCQSANAQDSEISAGSTGKSNLISLSIHKPFGEFSETHSIGIGLAYARSGNRFGRQEYAPPDKFGFTYEGGISWFLRKEENIGLVYTYKYPAFILIHGYGGLIYNHGKSANMRLIAGPALGIYDGSMRFNVGVDFSVAYFIKEKLSLSAGINSFVEPGAAPMVVAKLGGQFCF